MNDRIPAIDSRVTVSADMLTSNDVRVLARCPELETRLDVIERKLGRLIKEQPA